jgi:hydrogenase maturation factor
MRFANNDSRTLFFKYAAPCKVVSVERGNISKDYFDALMGSVTKGDVIEGAEDNFIMAIEKCAKEAKKLGSSRIGKTAVRNYFWISHDAVAKAMQQRDLDYDLKDCIVYPARVTSNVRGNHATVLTPVRSIECKTDFIPYLKRGDYVTVHFKCAAEVISENDAKRLWNLKCKK